MAPTAETFSLSIDQPLAYVGGDGEILLAIDGEDVPTVTAAQVVCLTDGHPAGDKIQYESGLDAELPSLDIDSSRTYIVRVTFYKADGLLSAAIVGEDDMDIADVRYVVEYIANLLAERMEAHHFADMAREARELPVAVLRRRIRLIEESVRAAVADDELTDEDYFAMRDYPTRLARVEHQATDLPVATWERFYDRKSSHPDIDLYWKKMPEVASDARAAISRLSGLLASQSVVLGQRQQRETARFQRVVTIIGAAVLVPGLVAAVFGANVGFHGRNSTGAFWAMLVLMLGSGVTTFALIQFAVSGTMARIAARLGKDLACMLHLPEPERWSAGTRATLTLSVGLVVLALGLLVLSTG